MWIVPACAVLGFLLMVSGPWRRRERAAREGRSGWPLATLLAGGLLRIMVMVTVVGFLAAALTVQKGLFAEKHGRVTQRNLEAVRSKWGVPHHQRDLGVNHYVMRKIVREELANGTTRQRPLDEWRAPSGDTDRIIVDQEDFADPPGVPRKELNPRRLVRRVTFFERTRLEQDSVVASEVTVDVSSNPRRLGGAVYAGYNDLWRLSYTVRNRSERTTQAKFHFPLPAQGHGLYDRLRVEIDGRDWLDKVRYAQGSLGWQMEMAPNSEHSIDVGYASRGLGHFRYKPGDMRRKCLVTVNLHNVPAARLNFPIGSMPPLDDLSKLSGSDYSLHWDLSQAVSNQDIGIIVPSEPQPGYHVTRALGAAGTGVVVLAALLFLTRWLLSGRVELFHVSLVLGGLYVGHALLANLNDVLPSFWWAFALTMAPMAAAAGWFWRKLDGGGRLAWQSVALIALFYLVWPLLATTDEELCGALRYVVYAGLLVYLLALVAYRVHAPARSQAAAQRAGGGDRPGDL